MSSVNSIDKLNDIRLLIPETIWLEIEHFDEAQALVNLNAGSNKNSTVNQLQQWQAYLNALALFGLETWLNERIKVSTSCDTKAISQYGIIKVGEFKICLIAAEQILDEVVNLPQQALNNSEAIHFYALLEVNEEQEQLIIRGFIRYDQLVNYLDTSSNTLYNNCYQLPLSLLDTEPSHLLFYIRYVEPSTINSQVGAFQQNSLQNKNIDTVEVTTKLSNWLQNIFDDTWQLIDTMVNREASLAFSTRSIEQNISESTRGKLIDLGMQINNQKLALLVSITEQTEGMNVLVQLHPTNGEQNLPPNITLTLLSKAKKNLQQVESRALDNYIQLRPFRGEMGKKFSIEVKYNDATICENFEL